MAQWSEIQVNGVVAVAHIDSPTFTAALPHHIIDKVMFPSTVTDNQATTTAKLSAMVGKTYHDWLQLK